MRLSPAAGRHKVSVNHYELYFDEQAGEPRTTMVYAVEDDGQMRLVAASDWGPFDTQLEIAQWAWRWLTIDIARTKL